tara:strand:+ start:480 stop:821 length:342 start_codon:yes stop_codon:yes gene_type:complete
LSRIHFVTSRAFSLLLIGLSFALAGCGEGTFYFDIDVEFSETELQEALAFTTDQGPEAELSVCSEVCTWYLDLQEEAALVELDSCSFSWSLIGQVEATEPLAELSCRGLVTQP